MSKKKPRVRPVRRAIITLLSLIILTAVGYAGWYGYSIYHFAQSIHKEPSSESSMFHAVETPDKPSAPEPPKWTGTERVNILLMGGDSRGLAKGEVPRSDSMLLVSVDPVTKQADLFSIMRDTYVPIPGHGKDRINAALAFGGPDLAVKTVSDFLNVPIQYYVYTDFKGFIAMIDAIGGIDYYVEKNMHYTDSADDYLYDINLKKGYQHLDGKTALEYVRFRHDALSDFARTQRQRNFLKAVAAKLKSTQSLMKLPAILEKISPYIQTNMTITDMWKLGSLGYQVHTGQVQTAQLPPDNLLRDINVDGADMLGTDETKVQQYVQGLFNKPAGTGTDGASQDGSASSGTGGNGSSAGADAGAGAGTGAK